MSSFATWKETGAKKSCNLLENSVLMSRKKEHWNPSNTGMKEFIESPDRVLKSLYFWAVK